MIEPIADRERNDSVNLALWFFVWYRYVDVTFYSNETGKEEGKGKGKRAKESDCRRCDATYMLCENPQHSIKR